jgi:CRP-like cAMP-binding protein
VRGNEVARIGPGDAFGELALVDLSDRSATVTVLAPMQCWVLASWFFRPFVQEHPSVAWRMIELLVERLRAAQSV